MVDKQVNLLYYQVLTEKHDIDQTVDQLIAKQLRKENPRHVPECWPIHSKTTMEGKPRSRTRVLTNSQQNNYGGKTQVTYQSADQVIAKQLWKENSRNTSDCWPNSKQLWKENLRHVPDCWPNSRQLWRKIRRHTLDCWPNAKQQWRKTQNIYRTTVQTLNNYREKTEDAHQTVDQLTTTQLWKENSRRTSDCWPPPNKTTMKGKPKTYDRLLTNSQQNNAGGKTQDIRQIPGQVQNNYRGKTQDIRQTADRLTTKQRWRENRRHTTDYWLTHNKQCCRENSRHTPDYWPNSNQLWRENSRHTPDCWPNSKQLWRENSKHTPDCWPNSKQLWRENPRNVPECWPS